MLVEFASVVDAVRCVVEIQRGMLERNADIPSEKRIDFRVGINVGDVIVDGDDIYGDGVNVAARLEGLVEPAASWWRGWSATRCASRSGDDSHSMSPLSLRVA